MNKDEISLRRKFFDVWSLLDERSRRLMAASEARSLGYGGVSKVRRACGLSRKAIAKGMHEISDGNTMPGRIRRTGAGRKKITVRDPKLLASLEHLVEPETRRSESPCAGYAKTPGSGRSTDWEEASVSRESGAASAVQGYSLQSNRKTEEGADHVRRASVISTQVKRALATGIPVYQWTPRRRN
jgi:hypothetical protein